jgi:hypothetical protein
MYGKGDLTRLFDIFKNLTPSQKQTPEKIKDRFPYIKIV